MRTHQYGPRLPGYEPQNDARIIGEKGRAADKREDEKRGRKKTTKTAVEAGIPTVPTYPAHMASRTHHTLARAPAHTCRHGSGC